MLNIFEEFEIVIKSPEWKTIWKSRQRLQWQDQAIWVVSYQDRFDESDESMQKAKEPG